MSMTKDPVDHRNRRAAVAGMPVYRRERSKSQIEPVFSPVSL